MSEIITQVDVDAAPEALWGALTTTEGLRSWWTTQAEASDEKVEVRFPDAPMAWELRVDEAVENERLHWHCVGGPPPWVDTDVVFRLEGGPDGGTRVVFDHTGWKDAEEMVRVVTFGWIEMLQRLRAYAASGTPQPYFDF